MKTSGKHFGLAVGI